MSDKPTVTYISLDDVGYALAVGDSGLKPQEIWVDPEAIVGFALDNELSNNLGCNITRVLIAGREEIIYLADTPDGASSKVVAAMRDSFK